jgi:hypothetical protein
MSSQRIYEIRYLLSQIANSPIFNIPHFSDQIFEVYCYLKKVEEFRQNGKAPLCVSKTTGIFRPLHKPGLPRNGDYFHLMSNSSRGNLDIILNGTFEGPSGISHSPDIAVTDINQNKVITFYECKNYSGSLGPGVYREIIGYYKEFKCKKNPDYYDVATPSIYTSGTANDFHKRRMKEKYNVIVNDLF